MLHDTDLAATALRICADRGITPAETLNEPPLSRRDFYRTQITERIHTRWAGRFDHAQPIPPVAAWLQRHLTDPQADPALFLHGATGVGKTHNAVAALRAIGHHHADHGRGLTWYAVTHPDLAHELRPKNDGSHEHALDRYLDAELLILDDLGAGMTREWGIDCLQRLIDHRWTRRTATIYTTNLQSEALKNAIGDRAYSRLGDATLVHITGDDRRWTR